MLNGLKAVLEHGYIMCISCVRTPISMKFAKQMTLMLSEIVDSEKVEVSRESLKSLKSLIPIRE